MTSSHYIYFYATVLWGSDLNLADQSQVSLNKDKDLRSVIKDLISDCFREHSNNAYDNPHS